MSERKTYRELKKIGVSTLTVNKLLKKVGIVIANKTLQNYLDSDFENVKDVRIKIIVDTILENHKNLVELLNLKLKENV